MCFALFVLQTSVTGMELVINTMLESHLLRQISSKLQYT